MSFSEGRKGKRKTVRPDMEVFDQAMALASVGSDAEFLNEVVGLVQAAWPTLLAHIREAIAKRNLPAVEMSARLAKAAARNVSSRKAYESALQLETMAGKGDLQGAQRASANLEQDVEKLQSVLSKVRNFAWFWEG